MKKVFTVYICVLALCILLPQARAQHVFYGLSPYFTFDTEKAEIFYGYSGSFVFNTNYADHIIAYSDPFVFNTHTAIEEIIGYSDVFTFNTTADQEPLIGYSPMFTFNTTPGEDPIVAFSGMFSFNTSPKQIITGYSDPFLFDTEPEDLEIVGYSDMFVFNTTPAETVIGHSEMFVFDTRPEEYEVVVEIVPENAGTVEGAGIYAAGDEVTLEASPNEGYAFVNWTDDAGEEVWDEKLYVFVMPDEDLILTANFELIDYVVTVAVDPENAGTVTGDGTYNMGDEVTLEATPNEGYAFDHWADEADNALTDDPVYTFIMPQNNVLLTAYFQEDVGVYDIVTQNITIYPNPARTKLFVSSEHKMNSVRLIDLHGSIIKEQKQVEELTVSFDVSSLNTAVYFIQVDVLGTKVIKRVQIINK